MFPLPSIQNEKKTPFEKGALPACHIAELELVEPVAGLGIFELSALIEERVVRDDDDVFIIVQVEPQAVELGHVLGRDLPFGVTDLHPELVLDIGVNRLRGDLFRQPRNEVFDEIVHV